MNIEKLCLKIKMPEPMLKMVMQANDELDFHDDLPLNLLMNAETGLMGFSKLSEALGEDPLGVKQLACQLHCACRRYETYCQMGIPDQIFFDTMSCYSRFVMECLYYKGGYQFDRGWWTWRQLSMRVFRLGQLEYERLPDGNIAMHIPTGSDLKPACVKQSVRCAKAFMDRYFPERSNARYTCNSWLLSPALSDLLSQESNILAFQKLFELTDLDPEAMDYVSWLFQRLPGADAGDFPENTSLQRRAKQFILSGGRIGKAAGYLKFDKEFLYD